MASNPMSIQFLLNAPAPASAADPHTADVANDTSFLAPSSSKSKQTTPPKTSAVAPAADDADALIARSLQASLNRNPSRRSKQQITTLQEDQLGTPDDVSVDDTPADSKAYTIDDFVAVDSVSGHVLVRFVQGFERQWLPFVYLRWACPTLRDKSELVDKVKALQPQPIKRKYQRLDHPSIADFHPIVPLHYIPRLDDGTPEGKHERLVYRLQGRHIVGVALLEAVRKSYCESSAKLKELDRFVAARKTEITLAGKNQSKLVEIMGLLSPHHDLMPQRTAYAFTNFRFLIGKPPSAKATGPSTAATAVKQSAEPAKKRVAEEPAAAKKRQRTEPVSPEESDHSVLETAKMLMGLKHGRVQQGGGEEMTFMELVIPSPRTLSDDENDAVSSARPQ